MDAAVVLSLAALVWSGLFALVLWAVVFADLMWMLTLRASLVGSVLLAVVVILFLALSAVAPMGGLQATRFLLVLALAPLLTRPLSDRLAHWRDKSDLPPNGYVFASAEAARAAAFRETLQPPSTAAHPAAAD
jgi:hypothetical protein